MRHKIEMPNGNLHYETVLTNGFAGVVELLVLCETFVNQDGTVYPRTWFHIRMMRKDYQKPFTSDKQAELNQKVFWLWKHTLLSSHTKN